MLAVDWSGAIKGGYKKIWLAEATGHELVGLESGRTREFLVQHLIDLAERDSELIVGLDFAFSYPAWFLEARGVDVFGLWELAVQEGERWLASCQPPFWGRRGKLKPIGIELFRRTELNLTPVAGITPKSVFRVAGAGAVGTGSIRGMAALSKLRKAGFSIWPFDPFRLPAVIEIYPRVLTGVVCKSIQTDRSRYLSEKFSGVTQSLLVKAASSEDAFDAAVSALVMASEAESLTCLTQSSERLTRLEGSVWFPNCGAA
jgi:hypothetical protein